MKMKLSDGTVLKSTFVICGSLMLALCPTEHAFLLILQREPGISEMRAYDKLSSLYCGGFRLIVINTVKELITRHPGLVVRHMN